MEQSVLQRRIGFGARKNGVHVHDIGIWEVAIMQPGQRNLEAALGFGEIDQPAARERSLVYAV